MILETLDIYIKLGKPQLNQVLETKTKQYQVKTNKNALYSNGTLANLCKTK